MNSVLEEDLKSICDSNMVDWKALKGSSILITGATGLIGSLLVKSLIKKNEIDNLNIKMFLLVRNKENAIELFGDNSYIEIIETEIENFVGYDFKVDYIFHAASPTKSNFFISKPVETLNTAILGTRNVLEFAKQCEVKSFIYLSSMEMYGVLENSNVTEDVIGYIKPLDTRSSYSEGKRVCELYCFSYMDEYDIPVKIARIAQTFGAGIGKNETRVYKQFADSVIKGDDIVLKSTGETVINFSYTVDTIIGLLCILLKGENGEAYNIVSDGSGMTILDSAKWLIERYGNGSNTVVIDISKEKVGYAPNNKMILSNSKLKKLGWNSKYNIEEGYDRLIAYLKEENKG